MGDELLQEIGQRRTGPRDPAVGLEKPPLALAPQQRLAVVELEDELDPVARRLDRVEQPEAGPARPGGERPSAEHAVGEQVGGARRELLRNPERHPEAGVDRAAERDHRAEALVAAVGGGLVAEHPALRVAAEVHVAAGLAPDPVDGIGDRDHVVGERSLESPLLALGRPEVDDPRIDPVVAQDRHRAGRRRDVVDLGREHHRRHQQDRRPTTAVVVAQLVDAMLGGDLVRRRLLVGRQAAEASDLQRVLRRGSESAYRPRDRLRHQLHRQRHIFAQRGPPWRSALLSGSQR